MYAYRNNCVAAVSYFNLYVKYYVYTADSYRISGYTTDLCEDIQFKL
jgi:hypothetical protein